MTRLLTQSLNGQDTVMENRAEDPATLLLTWRSHPVRQGGKRLVLVAAALLGFPSGLALLYGPSYGILAFLILAGSLMPYFLPTRYSFYTGGLETVFLGVHRRFTWKQFRSFYADAEVVFLSPFVPPSGLENFRGVYLRFGDRPADILSIISDRVGIPSVSDPLTGGSKQ